MLAIFEALSHSSQEGNFGLTVSGLARAEFFKSVGTSGS